VSIEHGVDPLNLGSQSLLPEIGRGVDQNAFAFFLHPGRSAQAMVLGVPRATYRALARDQRNAGRGAAAEDGQDHSDVTVVADPLDPKISKSSLQSEWRSNDPALKSGFSRSGWPL
jgi:hypothetical protein